MLIKKLVGTLAQMNPLLRSPDNNQILWPALLDGVIDFEVKLKALLDK